MTTTAAGFKSSSSGMLSQHIQEPNNKRIWVLITLFLVLNGLGLLNLYSASEGNAFGYFYVQLRNLGLGFVVFLITGWLIPIRLINDYAKLIYLVTCIALLLVLVLGKIAGGSQRWINFGFIAFQPSELAKVSVAIIVARFFFNHKLAGSYRLRDLWPVVLTSGIIFGLIFKQPDLGTAGICLIIAAIQILFVPIDRASIAIVATGGLVSTIVGWNFLLHPYQKLRILNLLNPNLDPAGSGYNSLQSLVAIGSGGGFGKGLMQGTQTQLKFLPARHTDFVFSVFAEEHGFFGCMVVFLLFCILTYVILDVARKARNTFNALLAIGIAGLLFSQFMVNVAMVLGVFPVVGLPLPFFSYGGSSLLVICMAMGLLVAIERDTQGSAKLSTIGS